jgi:ferredoxin-NADP reductase
MRPDSTDRRKPPLRDQLRNRSKPANQLGIKGIRTLYSFPREKMLTTSVSLAMGIAFVLVGGINVWLVLEATARVKAARSSSRMLALHRIGGYLFIALFCVMSWYMLARLRSEGADGSATVTLHLALAMLLSPMLFIKVLVARYYKNHHGLLMPIGLAIFILAFVLIASTAGPYLARASKVERVSIDPGHLPAVAIDLNRASELMQRRCSKCHNLDRVVGARKDAQGWLATMARMQKMPGAGITDSDAQTIVSWLVSQNRPGGSDETVRLAVDRAIVDQRCGRCHGLDRVYKTVETSEEWRDTVVRMAGYASGSSGALQPGEDQKIIDYLSATRSPAAMSQQKVGTDAASGAGQSPAAQTPSAGAATSPVQRFDGRTTGFFSLVGLGVTILIVRRPGNTRNSAALPSPQPKTPTLDAPRRQNGPMLLQLVRVMQQTADSKTLRFAVCGPQKPDALPGQFLTFSFLFRGRKEVRCYSICSSPARSGYVEITAKRVANGCVSVFLNDQAAIGMTVEATGPFGKFFLKPEDRKIVLVAAGSGITPMMAMLRYIDDYCLDIEATLLYCVRTSQEMMFRQELDDLQMRLKRFRYSALLSQPEPGWPGARGRINRGFIAEHVADMNGRVFFLCGPPPFMDSAASILSGLGVEPERIRTETFGGAGTPPRPAQPGAPDVTCTVEFARSGRRVAIPPGQTILEAAAENGVAIPSGCRQGQCGSCKARLLDGVVHMTTEQGLDAEAKARGLVLTCVGYPDGDVRLDV